MAIDLLGMAPTDFETLCRDLFLNYCDFGGDIAPGVDWTAGRAYTFGAIDRYALVIRQRMSAPRADLERAILGIGNPGQYARIMLMTATAVIADDVTWVRDTFPDHRIEIFDTNGIQGLRHLWRHRHPQTGLLVTLDELCNTQALPAIRISLEEINDRLIAHLARYPEVMHNLDPRRFEELVAELFSRMNYEVILTPRSRDRGRDVIAVRREDVGTLLTLIECKRYSPDRKVGVGLVRALYGVVEEQRATHGIIATTSAFTRGAREFQNNLQYRLSLRDFNDLARWCHDYRLQRVAGVPGGTPNSDRDKRDLA